MVANETAEALGTALVAGKGIFATIFDTIMVGLVKGINWLTELFTNAFKMFPPDIVFLALAVGVAFLISKRVQDSLIFRITLMASLLYTLLKTASMLKGVA